MSFGIIIQARTGSKRFPNKVLNKINKDTILEFLINRLLLCFTKKEIYLATTKKKNDKKIVNIAKKIGINYYCGSEKDVSLRYLNCATKNKIKYIIRITSDCPLIDPYLIKKMKKKFLKNKLDYLANTLPLWKSTYPNGSDIEIFTTKALNKSRKYLNINKNFASKEHVTNIFWREEKLFKSNIYDQSTDQSQFKFSIDFKQDLKLVKYITSELKKKNIIGDTKKIINIIKKNKYFKKISLLSNIKGHKKRIDLKWKN